MNKVIVAGSRSITDYELVKQAIKESGFVIDELVSGGAKGVDFLGKKYAKEHNIPIKDFPAKWMDLTEEPVCIKIDKKGKRYNVLAGFNRNKQMAEYASHLVAIIKNNSSGTRNMINLAKEKGLIVYVKEV